MSVGLIPPSNPATASGLQLLGVYSASAGTSINCATRNQGSFSGVLFQSDFDEYEFEFINIFPGTNADDLIMRMSTDGGSSYDSGANYGWAQLGYRAGAGTAATSTGGESGLTLINLTGALGIANTALWGLRGSLKLFNPLSADYKIIKSSVAFRYGSGSFLIDNLTSGSYQIGTAVNACQFKMSTGTITGTILVYGKAKSASTGNTNVLSGTVVQVVNTETGTLATGTTQIPVDNTIPQNTEGDQYMSLAITPKSATNKLKIDVVFSGAPSVAQWVSVALFQDSAANAIAAGPPVFQTQNGGGVCITFSHYMTAGTASATTFKVRAGMGAAGTLSFNGFNGAQTFGGVMASSITITEIAV